MHQKKRTIHIKGNLQTAYYQFHVPQDCHYTSDKRTKVKGNCNQDLPRMAGFMILSSSTVFMFMYCFGRPIWLSAAHHNV